MRVRRHEREIVREGRFELLLPDHEQLFVYTRTWGGQVLLVRANMSSSAVSLDGLDLPDVTGAELLLGTHERGAVSLLRPWESTVHLLA